MIKAIETQYKGYKFRSRLEARWAVFFESFNFIQWEYEKEGYTLSDGTCYLPDFWINFSKEKFPGSGYFIEIKPYSPTVQEREKMLLLNRGTDIEVVCFWGIPDPETMHATIYSKGECFIEDGVFSRELQCLLTDCSPHKWHPMPFGYNWLIIPDQVKRNLIDRAARDAKSARFEYGERG